DNEGEQRSTCSSADERGWERRIPPDAECGTGNSCDGSRDENAQEPSVQNRAVDRLERAHERVIIYTSESGNDGAGEYEESSCEQPIGDRKSTRLNSSHVSISYAVFCLNKKK